MSPNEFQLRAALRDGEGESLDVDGLISHAVGVRRDRRRRLTAIAGGATLTAAVVAGASLIVATGGSNGSGGGQNGAGGAMQASASMAPRHPTSGTATRLTPATAGVAAVARANNIACPATPDRFALPGGGGSGQFGSTGALFGGQVAAVRVCVYRPTLQSATTEAGTQAHQLVSALESAPATHQPSACAPNEDLAGGTFEMYAVTATLHRLKPVVLTLGCGQTEATNGTAVRYVQEMPPILAQLMTAPRTTILNSSAPNAVQGSPVR